MAMGVASGGENFLFEYKKAEDSMERAHAEGGSNELNSVLLLPVTTSNSLLNDSRSTSS